MEQSGIDYLKDNNFREILKFSSVVEPRISRVSVVGSNGTSSLQETRKTIAVGVRYTSTYYARKVGSEYENMVFMSAVRDTIPDIFTIHNNTFIPYKEFKEYGKSAKTFFDTYRILLTRRNMFGAFSYKNQIMHKSFESDVPGNHNYLRRRRSKTITKDISRIIGALDNMCREWVHRSVYEKSPFQDYIQERFLEIETTRFVFLYNDFERELDEKEIKVLTPLHF